MTDHIVIINAPAHSTSQYLERLCRQFREVQQFTHTPIQLLTRQYPHGLPNMLRDLGVVHYTGASEEMAALDGVNAPEAAYLVVLARDANDRASDITTFYVLHELREMKVKGFILAECVDDQNRSRMFSAGAHGVVRPIRAYPGMIVTALVAPGSEHLFENLFSPDNDRYVRYDVALEQIAWSQVACSLMQRGYGTAVGYMDPEGRVHTNPESQRNISAKALYLMVHEDRMPTPGQVRQAMTTLEDV